VRRAPPPPPMVRGQGSTCRDRVASDIDIDLSIMITYKTGRAPPLPPGRGVRGQE